MKRTCAKPHEHLGILSTPAAIDSAPGCLAIARGRRLGPRRARPAHLTPMLPTSTVKAIDRRGPLSSAVSKRLEGDDRAGVLDARDRLHLFVDEVPDIGAGLDIKFDQKIELAGGRIDFRRDFGIRELVGHLVGFAEMAFDLDEEGNHPRLDRKSTLNSS